MPGSTPKLRFPAQLAVTATIVLGLAGAARLASSSNDAETFDQAAAQTRLAFDAAGRGVSAGDHVLKGRWRVSYDEPWFTGSVVYDLREEDDGIKGYLVEIVDADGRSFSDDSLILEVRTWDGTRGEGLYSMEYGGERYETECDIELQPAGGLRVRYSYYGYLGDELWTRLEAGAP